MPCDSNISIGIGLDCCSITRWDALCTRRPQITDRFLGKYERGLTPSSQAARWAAKEALVKATGISLHGRWNQCQVVNDQNGRPRFIFSEEIRHELSARGINENNIAISITHEETNAIAVVFTLISSSCQGEQP